MLLNKANSKKKKKKKKKKKEQRIQKFQMRKSANFTYSVYTEHCRIYSLSEPWQELKK